MRSLYRRVVVFGAGEVVHDRVCPALKNLQREGLIERFVFIDPKPNEKLDKPLVLDHPDQYHCNADGKIPFRWLDKYTFLGDETLVLNCTPTAYHIPIAREIAGHVGRVAVEKPLTRNQIEAAALLELESKIFCIGHQMWKRQVRSLTERSRSKDIHWGQFSALHFGLQERIAAGNRDLDCCIFDLAWHGLEVMLAPVFAAGFPAGITIQSSKTSTYKNGPDQPRQTTACAIDGVLHLNDQARVPFALRCGKGLATSSKSLVCRINAQDEVLATLDDDGPAAAHERLIRELLTKQSPDMQLSLRDVVNVVEACADASENALEMPAYDFGTTPHWLKFPTVQSVPAPHMNMNAVVRA